MTDSIWPCVHVNGDLSKARIEWILGNGIGAYASSTVALMHTRRYHGLLIAPLAAPLRRTVILSHFDTRAHHPDGDVDLSSHQFPGVLPKQGYQHLVWFYQDPLPRWLYELHGDTLEQTIALVRGANALVMRYLWQGPQPLLISARPLLGLRCHHCLTHAHGAMIQRVSMRPNEVHVQPISELPPIAFRHMGMFIGSPDWWHRFEYLAEQDRGLEFQEDLWSPGAFRLTLQPGVAQYLVVGLGGLPEGAADELMKQAEQALIACDPGENRPNCVRKLFVAADLFRADLAPQPAIIAGYPWFEIWARHTLAALDGLYLQTGRAQQAKQIVEGLLAHLQNGVLPNRLPEDGQPPDYNGADGALLLMVMSRKLVQALDPSDPFICSTLLPAMSGIFDSHLAGTINNIHVSHQGLLASGTPNVTSLTWMDARINNKPVTSRAGLAIELQAMWTKGCDNLVWLAERCGDTQLARRAADARDTARQAFPKRFWEEGATYPYDVVSESDQPPHAWAIASVRPNALIALAIDPCLFTDEQARMILHGVEQQLMTDVGLRSLSPFDPQYQPNYSGGVDQRDGAYHQGTVWPHLIGVLSTVTLRLYPNDEQRKIRLRNMIENALDNQLALGQVPELAQAEPPHRADGCTAFSCSVGELLRVLVADLAL